MFPFAQLRTLGSIAKYLGFLSFFSVSLAMVMSLSEAHDYSPYEATSVFSIGSLWDFLEATTSILFAYSGKNIYTEIVYEMREPKDSHKAMHLAYTVMIVIYSGVGLIGYSFAGSLVPAYFLEVITSSNIREVASIGLLVHVLFTIVLNLQIVARAVHSKVDSSSVDALHRSDEDYWRAVAVYLLITTLIFVSAFFVMNTVPFFTDFVEILGALLVPLHGFVVPMYLYYLLGKKRPECTYAMCFGWFLLAIFIFVVVIFGTYDSVHYWLEHSASIWSCDA
jgi:amino acid permease